ncbi:hypothetical protein HPB50_024593 [Hyalomma asiaticum]|uniref:Uncharacterized protein n=1 Tax=Hyalomma asiaticum TaxID=266040 RepID=A0ACB7RL12_HYAAI|nr:hypothetical protein HPB50_024593 [Hyalomma asiaticum]
MPGECKVLRIYSLGSGSRIMCVCVRSYAGGGVDVLRPCAMVLWHSFAAKLVFEDVLAEPDASHGFDGAWKLTYLVFTSTRLWCYRLLSALLALPCGLTWGLLFSLLSLVHVWLLTPTLRVFDVILHVVHRVWGGLVRTLLDPVFQSVGKLAGDVRVTRTQVYPKNDFAHDP